MLFRALAALVVPFILAPSVACARCSVTLEADGNTAAIQRQMDANGPRPIVCLRPGHYRGARLIASRDAEVRAVGEGRVVLDAGGRGRVLSVVKPGVHVTFVGITLTEGSVEQGGAVAVEANAVVRLESCWLTRNKATRHGGAVYVREGRVELVSTRVSANSAATGSALWAEDGGALMLASTLVHDNKSRGGADDAAIVVRATAKLSVFGSTVVYNPGHGIHVAPAGPDIAPAAITVDSSVVMGAPDAISVVRDEAGEAMITRSVLYGRTGFLPLDLVTRRELPVFDLESAERYRPTYGSPAIGIGQCHHPDTRRDVAGERRRGRCTAGAVEASAEASRKTIKERAQRDAIDRAAEAESEPDFWPSDRD